MPENILPPTDGHDGDADDNENASAFEEFVNQDLDFSALDSSGGASAERERPPGLPFRPLSPFPPRPPAPPDPLSGDESPFGSLRRALGSEPPPRNPFTRAPVNNPFNPPRQVVPLLNDPRWVRGVYRVQRDLRVYKAPSKIATKITTVADAHRRVDKSLRYIPNITLGWSAVHLYGQEPIIGFVENIEVRLLPRRGLRDMWENIALAVCVLLLLFALIANLDQLPFFTNDDRMQAMETTIADQQSQIEALEATISAMRGDSFEDRQSEREGTELREGEATAQGR